MQDWLALVRRDFHQYPELGMNEKRTAMRIAEYLKEMNIEYIEGIANTGIVGIIRGCQEGRTVALRADMDALPIQEASNAQYRSKIDGKMHACGHDAHIAIQLGAAKVLNEIRASLKGNIKLIFQPSEETIGGAQPMVEAGVLENPHVDVIFGLHVDSELDVGSIGIKHGTISATSDSFSIIIEGTSAHGAYPHLGIDAVIASAHIITALQTVISRNTDPLNPAVLSIGKIQGGTAENIICDCVEMHGTIRALHPKAREVVLKNAASIVEETARALGSRGKFISHKGYPAIINDDIYVDIIKANGKKLIGEEWIINIEEASLGVEDFSFFLEKTPGAYYFLGCRNESKGITYNLHQNLFDIDESCLPIGVAMQVENVRSILG